MKKNITTLALIIISFASCFAQTFVHEFGKFSQEEFTFNKYDKDPSAEAVVIYDIGESFFTMGNDGFELVFEHKMKIKILTKAGIDWAQIEIPFYVENNRAELIDELKGNTYNYENAQLRVSRLDPLTAHDEKINEHWINRKFAMPDVKEGSVIEIYYKIRSPYYFNFRSWEFQHEIPVIYSEYSARMIPFYEYIYILQGTTKFDSSRTYTVPSSTSPFQGVTYDDKVYSFVLKDIPAFKDESFITSPDDYLIKIDFQLAAVHYPNGNDQPIMTTWEKLSEELLDDITFGKFVTNCKKKGKDIVDTMKFDSPTLAAKARKIDNFVKSNINWNGYSSKFTSQSVKDLLNKKTGNSADINLLLAGLLNYAGIEANPVIISTRDHGKIKLDYPFQHFFNYVIVSAKLDSSTVLLDATEPFSNFSEIPARCINEKGLVVKKGKAEWTNLKSKSLSNENYYIDMQLSKNIDSLKQNCRLISSGFEAIYYRNKYTSSYNDLKSSLIRQDQTTSDSIVSKNMNVINQPFELKFTTNETTEIVDGKIIISPFGSFPISKNPLVQPIRSYPVDMIYRKAKNFATVINLPDGYKLLSKPVDMKVNNSLVKIVFTTENTDPKNIKVTGIYEFKKDVYDPTEYVEIKRYFKMIVDKFSEKIVIDKEA